MDSFSEGHQHEWHEYDDSPGLSDDDERKITEVEDVNVDSSFSGTFSLSGAQILGRAHTDGNTQDQDSDRKGRHSHLYAGAKDIPHFAIQNPEREYDGRCMALVEGRGSDGVHHRCKKTVADIPLLFCENHDSPAKRKVGTLWQHPISCPVCARRGSKNDIFPPQSYDICVRSDRRYTSSEDVVDEEAIDAKVAEIEREKQQEKQQESINRRSRLATVSQQRSLQTGKSSNSRNSTRKTSHSVSGNSPATVSKSSLSMSPVEFTQKQNKKSSSLSSLVQPTAPAKEGRTSVTAKFSALSSVENTENTDLGNSRVSYSFGVPDQSHTELGDDSFLFYSRSLPTSFDLSDTREFVGAYDAVLDGLLTDLPDVNCPPYGDQWDLSSLDHEPGLPPRDAFSGPARSNQHKSFFEDFDWETPASFSEDIFREPLHTTSDATEPSNGAVKHVRPSSKRARSASLSNDEFPLPVSGFNNSTSEPTAGVCPVNCEAPQEKSSSSGITAVVQLPQIYMPKRWRTRPPFQSMLETFVTDRDSNCMANGGEHQQDDPFNRLCASIKNLDQRANVNILPHKKDGKLSSVVLDCIIRQLALTYSDVHFFSCSFVEQELPTNLKEGSEKALTLKVKDILGQSIALPQGLDQNGFTDSNVNYSKCGDGLMRRFLNDVLVHSGIGDVPLLDSAEYLHAVDADGKSFAAPHDQSNSVASTETQSSLEVHGSPRSAASVAHPSPSAFRYSEEPKKCRSSLQRPRSNSSTVLLRRSPGNCVEESVGSNGDHLVPSESAFQMTSFSKSRRIEDVPDGGKSVVTQLQDGTEGNETEKHSYRLHRQTNAKPLLLFHRSTNGKWLLLRVQWSPMPEIQVFGTREPKNVPSSLIDWLDTVYPIPEGWKDAVVNAISIVQHNTESDSAARCLLYAEKCAQRQHRQDIDAWTTQSEIAHYQTAVQTLVDEAFSESVYRQPKRTSKCAGDLHTPSSSWDYIR